MNKKVSLVIWIIAICAVLAATYTFFSKNKPQSFVTPSQQNKTTNQSSESSNAQVMDFKLKDLNGKSVKLSDYKGKIVILNFWAVWCRYCKQEMPDLNELSKQLEKDNKAVILAVDVQESPNKVQNYLSSNNINLRVLLDQDGTVSETYGVAGFPTTFIINKDGTLYTCIDGLTNKETLTGILNKMSSTK